MGLITLNQFDLSSSLVKLIKQIFIGKKCHMMQNYAHAMCAFFLERENLPLNLSPVILQQDSAESTSSLSVEVLLKTGGLSYGLYFYFISRLYLYISWFDFIIK